MDGDEFGRRLKELRDAPGSGFGDLASLYEDALAACIRRLDLLERPLRHFDPTARPLPDQQVAVPQVAVPNKGPDPVVGAWDWALQEMRRGHRMTRRIWRIYGDQYFLSIKNGSFHWPPHSGGFCPGAVQLGDINATDWEYVNAAAPTALGKGPE